MKNMEITDEMILQHEGLIYLSINKVIGTHKAINGVEREDLYQAGAIGLMKAYQGFDESYGTKFSTYAVPKIMAEMLKELRDRGQRIKIPREVFQTIRHISNRNEEFTVEELVKEFGITVINAKLTLDFREVRFLSTHAPINTDGAKDITINDLLVDDVNVENTAIYNITFKEQMSALDEREKFVVQALISGQYTQRQIGEKIGTSQVQVSRIYKRAIETMKEVAEVAV